MQNHTPTPTFFQKNVFRKSALISELELGVPNAFCMGHPDVLDIFSYLLAKVQN